MTFLDTTYVSEDCKCKIFQSNVQINWKKFRKFGYFIRKSFWINLKWSQNLNILSDVIFKFE